MEWKKQKPMTETGNKNRIRRSMLFMPGDSLRKISKAAQMDVDSIVMDLEDSVALNNKDEARRIVSEALHTLDFGRSERLIRLNAVETPFWQDDLEATIAAQADGYVLPKVAAAEHIQLVSRYLDEAEKSNGWPQYSIRLLALVETARGIMNLKEIAQAGPRLEALMFGAEDLAGDMGARRTAAGWEVFYARSAVATAAAAYGLQAIDMVLVDFNDMERLEEECVSARDLGYEGKMAIHPRQVEVMNRLFSPSAEEIEQAQRLIAAHEAHQTAGSGVFAADGKMVDMPVVKIAKRILEKAKAAGLLA
jgi:citrate lyase beta subunit